MQVCVEQNDSISAPIKIVGHESGLVSQRISVTGGEQHSSPTIEIPRYRSSDSERKTPFQLSMHLVHNLDIAIDHDLEYLPVGSLAHII